MKMALFALLLCSAANADTLRVDTYQHTYFYDGCTVQARDVGVYATCTAGEVDPPQASMGAATGNANMYVGVFTDGATFTQAVGCWQVAAGEYQCGDFVFHNGLE